MTTVQALPAVTLGPSASEQWLHAPEHLGMVLARYRAAAALIGSAETVLELGCGEGIGARILARNRKEYLGLDRDAAAIEHAVADRNLGETGQMTYICADIFDAWPSDVQPDAIVALDVIEHLEREQVWELMLKIRASLAPHGVAVIGTPSRYFRHLASARSKADHKTLLTPYELSALMAGSFHLTQSFGMQDVALHLGHPDARHYLLSVGIGPR